MLHPNERIAPLTIPRQVRQGTFLQSEALTPPPKGALQNHLIAVSKKFSCLTIYSLSDWTTANKLIHRLFTANLFIYWHRENFRKNLWKNAVTEHYQYQKSGPIFYSIYLYYKSVFVSFSSFSYLLHAQN